MTTSVFIGLKRESTECLYGSPSIKSNLFRHLRWLLLFSLLPSLSGCFGFGFWFERLDDLAVWQLDKVLDLDASQEALLEPEALALREWLRQETLPQTQALLEEAQERWNAGELKAATLMLESGFENIFNEFMLALAPRLTPLLKSLSDDNLRHWQEYASERYEDWYEESSSLEAKQEDRINRLEDWFGDLSDAQVFLVKKYTRWRKEEYALRVDNSDQWRNQIADIIQKKDWNRLEKLWSDPQSLQSPAYDDWIASERQDYLALMDALYPTLTDRQQASASKRLQGWLDKLAEVDPANI